MAPRYVSIPIARLKPHPKNTRTHSRKQVRQIADSIKEFRFTAPILVDDADVILAGHGRLAAAQSLGMTSVPTVMLSGLSDAKKRALLLADNRIAQAAGWDREALTAELEVLGDLLAQEGLQICLTGFEPPEIDALQADFGNEVEKGEDIDLTALDWPAISRRGDVWLLNKHRLVCGDARNRNDLAMLMDGEHAAMAFLDPPYNVRIGNVVGRGASQHREFAMASGEMTSEAFIEFLGQILGTAAAISLEGAVHFVCMDWRHLEELHRAGRTTYGAMLNLIAWVKTNAGQGSFYRSQHELIGVFRVGSARHLNNIELGRHGRNRSNVWNYAGVNTFRRGRSDDLRVHPTVKPVALIADAIKDCTRRGDIVLDSFCGSGSTLLAAERVGRRGFGLEIDPQYVDVAIRRWQVSTGRDAVHAVLGQPFDELAEQRCADAMKVSSAPALAVEG